MKSKKAKNFKLKDYQDKVFNLFEYQKKSDLLLLFFRGEWCNQCRKQLADLNKNISWFKKNNIKIVALSSDSELFTSILIEIIKPKYPILSDIGWKVFNLYGFKKPANQKKIKPALLLINQDHKIKYSYIGLNYLDRLTIPQLKKVITSHN
ncbi:MAG: peroxiredoxin family protein [bacterium]|nr:peroxiredoxin family protein [bacterium]